ncbi:hypothetical protein OS493_036629 [Desmophyllum pertusum]|uniref:Uncharacterized protein n=1 Tax=Desmophyllum pertusum TaxID=174260 RepID=A0A9X0CUK7_9CNID|nr:hypothetical protein OS493_036629 [Desmophyllum pertusum]
MAQIQPFQLEPEYSSDEDIPNHEEEEEEDVLVSEMNSCRLKNTSLCLCGHCTDMPSQKECLCCKELKNIAEDLHCVTQHGNFSPVCLNRDVLWTALASLHDRENAALPNRKKMSIKQVLSVCCIPTIYLVGTRLAGKKNP